MKTGVKYYYEESAPGATYGSLNFLVDEILVSMVASGAGILPIGERLLADMANGNHPLGSNIFQFLSNEMDTSNMSKPHGYLIWLAYDENFKLDQASSGALRVQDPNELGTLFSDEILIHETGFLHIYLSNGSQDQAINFDNFYVTTMQGKARQINHYYPYGLRMQKIGLGKDYKNMYTGKELQTGDYWDESVSTGLEMYDFEARFYDAQLGRWMVPDPAEQFSNPYLAMGNNPVMYVDPDGRYVPNYEPNVGGGPDGYGGMNGYGGLFGNYGGFGGNGGDYGGFGGYGGGYGNYEGFGGFESSGRNAYGGIYSNSPFSGNNYWANSTFGMHDGSFAPFAEYNPSANDYMLNSYNNGQWSSEVLRKPIKLPDGSYMLPTLEAVGNSNTGWEYLNYTSIHNIIGEHWRAQANGNNFLSIANYINAGIGSGASMLGGNFGLTANQTIRYAQKIGGKTRSAAILSRASRINSLRISRVLGRVSLIGGIIGTGVSINNIATDYQQGGWDQVNGWDVSDALVGTGGVAAGIFLATNPIGWGIAIGTGLYFGARLVYDLSTEP